MKGLTRQILAILFLLMTCLPSAMAQEGWSALRSPDAQGMVWLSVGLGGITERYDADGSRVELFRETLLEDENGRVFEAGIFGDLSLATANIGGRFSVRQVPGLQAGASVQLSNHTFKATRYVLFDDDNRTVDTSLEATSGLSLQNARLFVEYWHPSFVARVGYLLDQGPVVDNIRREIANTDNSNALWIGGTGYLDVGPVQVSGGLDYFATLQHTSDIHGDINPGDVIIGNLGVAYLLAALEVGAKLVVRSVGDRVGGEAIGLSGGSDLSVSPYAVFRPVNSPASVFVRASVSDEYDHIGFSISGKTLNTFRSGVTAGITMEF